MKTIEIRAPEEQTEGTRLQILRWLKAAGDSVAEHEPLVEIETDKVTVEVAAPASGVLREILQGEGKEVAPGEVLGRLEVEGASQSAGGERQGSGVAISHATQKAAPESSPHPVQSHASHAPSDVSPAVRRLIAEHGIDLAALRGTGPGGRITVDDVLNASSERAAGAPSADRTVQSKSSTSSPAQSSPDLPSHSIVHSAIRKRIAEHMVQSLLHTAPHVTTVFEADMSAIIAHRAAHKADFESRGAPLTFTAYFLSASAAALREVPEANSRWTDSALEIYDTINIGVATAIEDVGLVVPVIRAVDSKSLFEIAQGLNTLVTAARAGKLQPVDVRGGTFTISNHGVSGSLLAAPIVINQPQSAILGIGKLEKRVMIGDNDQIAVRPKCYVTLTIDHRVMDGHRANQFLQRFVKTLETWPAR